MLKQAFENKGAHITNLDEIRLLITRIENEASSYESAIELLETEMIDADATLMTDIRILINEYKYLSKERRPS
jgi:hypothetical protein